MIVLWNDLDQGFGLNTYFKETKPRFSLRDLVSAVIPLLLIELLCSLMWGERVKRN